ncbi:MAG: KUP/HAK/KT family potassium transporter [Propionibacteriaceae bacterium]
MTSSQGEGPTQSDAPIPPPATQPMDAPESTPESASAPVPKRPNRVALAADADRAAAHGNGKTIALTFGSIGVAFGDIGTSPLYALQTVFSMDHNIVEPNPVDVMGVISLVLWSITAIVTFKYLVFMLRANNDGEGGILALTALLRKGVANRPKLYGIALGLGMVGGALFYGDSVITPAISVMSAVEGLTVINHSFGQWVLPVSVAIITALFTIQRWGTNTIGRAFGPLMTVWFLTIGALGVPWISRFPDILAAISPHYALTFIVQRPAIAFISMGAIVLTITGAEALYADMGHFGKRPIRLGWFVLVFPALALNYLGQGAMILHDPTTIDNPFFRMAPDWFTLPLVILATLATVIASQAVISGAYSVTRTASRMGLFPRLTVKHTSKEEGGQIYMPATNWILYVGVLVLIATFRHSSNLAEAYGLAVTGTLVLGTILFLCQANWNWHTPKWKIFLFGFFIGGLELVFLAACLLKIPAGGWLPLVIAAIVITIMTTWRAGKREFDRLHYAQEGSLSDFIEEIRDEQIPRVPGLAVFPHRNSDTTPLALRHNVDFNGVVHQHVVLVTMIYVDAPHVRHVDRIRVNDLGYADDGIVHFTCRVGFTDSQDIPKALRLAIGQAPELSSLSEEDAYYFLSVTTLNHPRVRTLATWRKQLYVWLAHNSSSGVQVFHLPTDRTIVMGSHVEL